jgi:hypothetical protein
VISQVIANAIPQRKEALDTASSRFYFRCVEKIAIKRPLETEGIPPLIDDPQQALVVFEEILKRGALFYPNSDETSPRHSRVYRIVPLAES